VKGRLSSVLDARYISLDVLSFVCGIASTLPSSVLGQTFPLGKMKYEASVRPGYDKLVLARPSIDLQSLGICSIVEQNAFMGNLGNSWSVDNVLVGGE
jgi:hypothetical protein